MKIQVLANSCKTEPRIEHMETNNISYHACLFRPSIIIPTCAQKTTWIWSWFRLRHWLRLIWVYRIDIWRAYELNRRATWMDNNSSNCALQMFCEIKWWNPVTDIWILKKRVGLYSGITVANAWESHCRACFSAKNRFGGCLARASGCISLLVLQTNAWLP